MFHPIEDYIRVSNAASQAAMITAIVETLDKTEVALLESLNSRFTFFNDDDAAAVSELLGEQNTGPLIELFGAFSPMAFGLAVADLDAATAVPVGDRERYFLDLAEAWLTRTDAGLVYRAFVEIRGLEDGYADEFWPHLKAIEHSKSGEIIGVWDEASLAGLSPRAVDQEVSKPKENTTQRAGGMKARLTR
jgi:hypothetical protein